MPGNFIRGQITFEQGNKSTTSLIECTAEDFRFVPKLETGVRRTSSLDDITRFYRYFHLVQGNLGKLFTWQQYLKILQHQLSNLETLTILGKAVLPFMLVHQAEESKSVPAACETSNYVVQELDYVTATQAPLAEIKKTPLKMDSALADSVAPIQVEKVSPMTTPQFEFSNLCTSDFIQVHQEKESKSIPASATSNYAVRESDCVTTTQAPLVEVEKMPPNLDSELADSTAPTQIEKLSPMSTPPFEFADVCQSAEKSEGASTNYSTLSLINRTRVMMKICSETKTLAQNINKTADIISHLPHKCTECGVCLEGWMRTQNCIESIETGGDATGNFEDIKLEDPIKAECSNISPTSLFPFPSFSEKSSAGAGESTVMPTKTKDNPRGKGSSIKLLAKLCKQWVTRK